MDHEAVQGAVSGMREEVREVRVLVGGVGEKEHTGANHEEEPGGWATRVGYKEQGQEKVDQDSHVGHVVHHQRPKGVGV